MPLKTATLLAARFALQTMNSEHERNIAAWPTMCDHLDRRYLLEQFAAQAAIEAELCSPAAKPFDV